MEIWELVKKIENISDDQLALLDIQFKKWKVDIDDGNLSIRNIKDIELSIAKKNIKNENEFNKIFSSISRLEYWKIPWLDIDDEILLKYKISKIKKINIDENDLKNAWLNKNIILLPTNKYKYSFRNRNKYWTGTVSNNEIKYWIIDDKLHSTKYQINNTNFQQNLDNSKWKDIDNFLN